MTFGISKLLCRAHRQQLTKKSFLAQKPTGNGSLKINVSTFPLWDWLF